MQCHLASEYIHGQHCTPGQVSVLPVWVGGKEMLIQNFHQSGASRVLCYILKDPWPTAEENGKASEEFISCMAQGFRAGCRSRAHTTIYPSWCHIVYVVVSHQKSLSHQWIGTVEAPTCFLHCRLAHLCFFLLLQKLLQKRIALLTRFFVLFCFFFKSISMLFFFFMAVRACG